MDEIVEAVSYKEFDAENDFYTSQPIQSLPSVELSQKPFEPFKLQTIIGFNRQVPIRCLERGGSTIIMHSMVHLISLLDLKTGQHNQVIFGHKEFVDAIEHDKSERFLATADKTCVIVWDLHSTISKHTEILRMFYQPFGKYTEIGKICLSPCGKYLLIASKSMDFSTNYVLQLWEWSYGREECDATIEISRDYGEMKTIGFSQNEGEEEFIAVTMSHIVVFLLWQPEQCKLKSFIPDGKRFSEINASCYVTKTRLAVSVTNNGRLVLWGDLLLQMCNQPPSNEKNFLKAIHVKNCPINDVMMLDDYIATVDDDGEVRFYDNEGLLIYFCSSWKFPPIRFISPVTKPRNYKLVNHGYVEKPEDAGVELIHIENCPKDYTSQSKPFIIRNFIIATSNGQAMYCDPVKDTYDYPFNFCENVIVAMDHHHSENLVALCSKLGTFTLLDYEHMKALSEFSFLERFNLDDLKIAPKCTAVRLFPNANCVALGFEYGYLLMLSPLTGQSTCAEPYRYAKSHIRRIAFGMDESVLSYSDDNFTVVLLQIDENGEWQMIGKYCFHCGNIVGLFFLKFETGTRLVSIAEDRFYAEYNVSKSIEVQALKPVRDLRLEQTAKITAANHGNAAILEKDTSQKGQIIITANSEWKIKIYDAYNLDNLFTFLGPLFESPIRRIQHKPPTDDCKESFILLTSKRMLGVAVNPIDGNPFRYQGILVHPGYIHHICTSRYGQEIVVHGIGDLGMTIWKLNKPDVLRYFQSGGTGLLPFCTLIPGGHSGKLFDEIQEYFFCFQLLKNVTDAPQEYQVVEDISLLDVSHFMRAVGFFPSEWEIKNMLSEVTRTTTPWITSPTRISFSDLVKLYVNHKPVNIYKKSDTLTALMHAAKMPNEFPENAEITLDQIMEVLCDKAEAMPREQAITCVVELLTDKLHLNRLDNTDEEIFETLPKTFNLINFCVDVLGMSSDELDELNLYKILGLTGQEEEVSKDPLVHVSDDEESEEEKQKNEP